MNTPHYVEYNSPTGMLLPEDGTRSTSKFQSRTIKKYSFKDVMALAKELEENTYDFFTHQLKTAKKFQADKTCNLRSCGQDTFGGSKELALLACSHVTHKECSKGTFGAIFGMRCRVCNCVTKVSETYKDTNDFIDKIKLKCIHENCYFTTQYSMLTHYSNEGLTSLFDQILIKKVQDLEFYVKKKFVDEVQQEFANTVYQKGFLPIQDRKEVDDLVKDISINSKIQVIPQLNISKMKQTIVEVNEDGCPYPFTKYKDKTLDIFLKEKQDFVINFINKILQQKEYFASIYFETPVVFTDTGIEITLSGWRSSSFGRESLQYSYSDIQATTTNAIDGFKNLIIYLKTDLAIFDALNQNKISFNDDIPVVCIKPNWSSIEDFIIIKDGEIEVKISLSSFIDANDANTVKVNIDNLKQEIETAKLQLEAVNSVL
jgi:disulfide oxidoreductase YuzD